VGRPEYQAVEVYEADPVRQAALGTQALPDKMEPRVRVDQWDKKVDRVRKARKAGAGPRALREKSGRRATKGARDAQAKLVHLDRPDRQDQWVWRDPSDLRAPKAPTENLDPADRRAVRVGRDGRGSRERPA